MFLICRFFYGTVLIALSLSLSLFFFLFYKKYWSIFPLYKLFSKFFWQKSIKYKWDFLVTIILVG